MPRRPLPVARQVLLLQVTVVVVLVATSLALAAYDARRDARSEATDRAVAVSRSVADSPTVVAALGTADPSAELQPFATRVQQDAGVDFVTIMDLDRIRLTHRDPANIGKPFAGNVGDAPEGGTFTEEYAGTLGPSMRAVVPVRDEAGTVVAMVSVGITVASIDQGLRDDLLAIGLVALAVLAIGIGGALLVSRRLRRQTHGMGEVEITRMFEYYSAVLHAVREGLLLVDPDGVVQLVNDEATRLLDLPDDVVGRRLDALGLPPGLVAAALGRTSESDDLYVLGSRVLVVSSAPASWEGRTVGAVVSLRDHTELRSVTGELDVVRGLTESLRSANHEAANRLHTVVSLVELGRPDEAVAFATEELAVAQRLADDVVGAVGDPVVAALLLGKSAEARERGIDLEVSGALPSSSEVEARELVTVLGNLVDNAFEAVADSSTRRVRVTLGGTAARPVVMVEDSGAGLADDEAAHALDRGWTTKAEGRGLGLALVGQVARGHGGDVGIARSELGGAAFTVELGLVVRVLVVEDEELAAEAHASYVARLDGFELAGVARSAGEAARFLEKDTAVDLVLLDMHLPDGHGLGLLQRLRAAGQLVDVIAVTAARDADVVRHAVAQGVVLYLLKPFTFATFRAKLEQYADYRARLAAAPGEVVQDEVDRMLGSLRPTAAALPKGMSAETLRAVVGALREAAGPLSAAETAELVGASRVTARRYLEHLAETGTLERGQRYGGGRPEIEYRLR